jgi:hypothetical protein
MERETSRVMQSGVDVDHYVSRSLHDISGSSSR